MSASEPFIQGKAHELKQLVPMLRGGCFAQVFLLIGAYEVDPLGLTFSEIVDLTGLSKPSVSAAIKFLSRNNIITSQREDGAVRYRACFGFYYRSERVDLRAENENEVRNIFTSHDDGTLNENTDSSIKHPFIHEAQTRTILQEWIQGTNLDVLAVKVTPEIAELWVGWMQNCDRKQWRNPAGYCFGKLNADPSCKPPYIKRTAEPVKRKPTITGKFAK